jgi:hypothetical protein
MTITVFMTRDAIGEDGELWEQGTLHDAGDVFAHRLFADKSASAPFLSNDPVVVRNVGDGYELVMRNGLVSQLTGAWDDLRFPVQAINPAGSAAPPAVDEVLTSFPGTLLFAGNAENVIAGVAQMPHAWRAGSPIRPHIHWSKPVGSASAVAWEFYYRHLGFPNDVAADWVGPIAGTIVAGDQETANAHIISSFGEIDMGRKRESSCLCWQIRRQGGTDADNGTARLYEFDIHYMVDKSGTPDEIPPGIGD